MRKLLFTRGVSGSGKSTVLRNLNLDAFTVSYDKLRLLFASPTMLSNGELGIDQSVSPKIFEFFYNLLEARMIKGETLVIDGTHNSTKDWQALKNYADTYQYEIACLDFSNLSIDEAASRNKGRDQILVVPHEVLLRQKQNINNNPLSDNIKRIIVDDTNNYIQEVQNFLQPKLINLDQYKRVIHIGDLQGCYSVFQDFQKAIGQFKKDDFIIFVGDALDRGIENGKIMRWLIDYVPNNPNTVFLWGNHEDHISREANDLSHVSSEFTDFTLPQLNQEEITKQELKTFISSVKDLFTYEYQGKKVLVTHGGLSAIPKEYWYLSTNLYSHGTGNYNDPVDEMWNKNVLDQNYFQIHGHRNSKKINIQTGRSFNLESQVEFGGFLRSVILDEKGFHDFEIPNKIYKSLNERVGKQTKNIKPTFSRLIVPEWCSSLNENSNKIPEDIHKKMLSHKGIKARSTENYPHIEAFNFTRDVFYDKSWDDIVVKARGLFVNKYTREIVARGYDKFFNMDERPETTIKGLSKTLKFPIKGYLKENGYFGTIGYDSQTGNLFITSKSAPEGDFALNIIRIFNKKFNNIQQNDIKVFLKDTNSCMTFEVIDPIFDPHIVEYSKEDLVLLDVIQRSHDFKKIDYEDLKLIGKNFNMTVKEKCLEFNNIDAFISFYDGTKTKSKKQIEGYVFEDTNNFLFKIKLPFYNYWKWARTIKDGIWKAMEKKTDYQIGEQKILSRAKELNCEHMIDDMKLLIEWMKSKDVDFLKQDIITIRKSYLNQELKQSLKIN